MSGVPLEEMKARKKQLLEELARRGPEEAKESGVLAEIKAVQAEIREAVHHVPEHVLGSEEWPLSHEDIEKWIETRYFQFAATMAHVPHEYTLKKWGDGLTFELINIHIREFGYPNRFGSREFMQYDAGGYSYWSMGNSIEGMKVLNRRPLSVAEKNPPACKWRATKTVKARVLLQRLPEGGGSPLEVDGIRIERGSPAGAEPRFRWVSARRTSERDLEQSVKKLAGYKAAVLDALVGNRRPPEATDTSEAPEKPPLQPELEEPSPEPPRPPRPSPRHTWTIWARGDDGDEDTLLATVEGTKADAYVHLMLEQAKLEPKPFVRLRAGTDPGSRPVVGLRPGGWRNEPTAILEQSELYEQVIGPTEKEEV